MNAWQILSNETNPNHVKPTLLAHERDIADARLHSKQGEAVIKERFHVRAPVGVDVGGARLDQEAGELGRSPTVPVCVTGLIL